MLTPSQPSGMGAIARVMNDVFYKVDFTLVSESAGRSIESRLNNTVLHGGKRFRPVLLALFGNFMGLEFETLAPYARAVELAHAATLAHDDIIDEAHERRNVETLNRMTSNSHAVLGGDFLLARVVAEIARLGNIRILQEMAEVLEELVSGEWLQLEARGIISVDHQHLETVARKKTASLISWSCTTPAILRGLSNETVELCRDFGNCVGVAFQQMDDLLDFQEGTGKTFAKDLDEGQVNFVALELIRQFPQLEGPIAALLGKEGASGRAVSWPWTPQQLEQALESVRALAQKRVGHADRLLTQIQEAIEIEGHCVREDALAGLRETLTAIVKRSL